MAFTNSPYIKKAGVLDTFISDHQPIFLIKKKPRNSRPGSVNFRGRSYRNYDKQKFIDNLASKDWSKFYNSSNVDEAWKIMEGHILEEANEMCPVRDFRIGCQKPAWISDEMIEQMKDCDYFYKRAKISGDEDTWNIAKFHRNLTNKYIRQSKADFIKNQLSLNEGNSSKFWRLIKDVMPDSRNKKQSTTIKLLNEGQEIPEDFVPTFINNLFTEVGNVAASDQLDKCPPTVKSENSIPNVDSDNDDSKSDGDESGDETELDEESVPKFKLKNVRKTEVLSLISKINISKSSGMTQISSGIVKDSLQVLLSEITWLFNFSLKTETFPTHWKKALIIQIPKTGDPLLVNNYRPISLLPLPGKVLEKLIHTQLTDHIEENNLISNNQFGFRKQRATTHAITQFLNQVYTNINKSALTAAIYIDFRKAFDCVQHKVLIDKLGTLFLDETTISWINNYLTNRTQRTLANNKFSPYRNITQGVPQGSILGPLLYIIYANDISECTKKSGYTFYADDTVIYTTKKNMSVAAKDLQQDLNNLTKWCTTNKIYINPSKTKLMFFGSKQALRNSIDLPTFTIHNTNVARAQYYSYLGIKMDEQLSFTQHGNNIISKVSNKLYQLRKIRPFINKKAAILIYKNMILPILEYGDIILDSATAEIKRKLQTLQNKALRCALNRDMLASSTEIHEEAKLRKLKDRRREHMLLHMFQISHTKHFDQWKQQSINGIRTRSSKKKLIMTKKPRNEKLKKSISYQGPKLWNKLPEPLQRVENYYEFKQQLRKSRDTNLCDPVTKGTKKKAKQKINTPKRKGHR